MWRFLFWFLFIACTLLCVSYIYIYMWIMFCISVSTYTRYSKVFYLLFYKSDEGEIECHVNFAVQRFSWLSSISGMFWDSHSFLPYRSPFFLHLVSVTCAVEKSLSVISYINRSPNIILYFKLRWLFRTIISGMEQFSLLLGNFLNMNTGCSLQRKKNSFSLFWGHISLLVWCLVSVP
jgi:hypothetical protein